MASISFVLLFYNDEHTVASQVNDSRAALESIATDYEIIAINDCSSDHTARGLDNLRGVKNLKVLSNERNLGVGASFRKAILHATKEYTGYTDGDYQYDVSSLPAMVKELTTFEVVSGYRNNRSDGWYRSLISTHYNFLLDVFYG